MSCILNSYPESDEKVLLVPNLALISMISLSTLSIREDKNGPLFLAKSAPSNMNKEKYMNEILLCMKEGRRDKTIVSDQQ